MPRPSDEATPPTRSKSIRLRSIFKPLRSSGDNDTPPVPLLPALSPSPSTSVTDFATADFATAPPSRSTSLHLHTPRLHTPPLRKLASASSSGGLRSTGQEDVLRKRRQALLEASQSMGLIEGVQGHEAFARNLLGKHEQFGEFGSETGERDGVGEEEEVNGGGEEGEGNAIPVDCYVPSTAAVGGSVPASPFQGRSTTAVGVLKGLLTRSRAGDFFPSISRQSTHRSFASNVFDDTDALSAGIREYVESKIAESLHRHSPPAPSPHATTSFTTFLNTLGTGNGNGVNLTVKLRLPDPTAASPSSQSTGALFPPTTTTTLPNRLGPLPLPPTPNTLPLHLGITAIYTLTLLFAAFLGPLTLLATLWRMAALLAGYAVFSRLCGWDGDAAGVGGDLLLAPALRVCDILGGKVREGVRLYTEWKVGVWVRALREVLGEAEAEAEVRGEARG